MFDVTKGKTEEKKSSKSEEEKEEKMEKLMESLVKEKEKEEATKGTGDEPRELIDPTSLYESKFENKKQPLVKIIHCN